MKTTLLLTVLPVLSLMAGCGSAPHDDAAQSSDDALTVYKSGKMNGAGLALLESLAGVGGASINATEGALHFVPSPQMAALGTAQIDYPSSDFVDVFQGTNAHVRFQSFSQVGAPTFAFEASGPGSIDMHLVASGSLYILGAFCFNGTFYDCVTGADKSPPFYATLTGTATVDARFVVDPNGVLGVDDVKVSYPYGPFQSVEPMPIYDMVTNGDRAEIEKWLGGEIKNALAQGLAVYQSTWIGSLNKYANYTRFVQNGFSQPPWQVIPPSLSVAGGGMAWTAKREYATTAPTGCKTSTACESYVNVVCTPSTDRLELELLTGGQWVKFMDPISATTTNAFSFTANGAAWLPLRVCAVNGTGRSCGAPMTVVPNHAHCPPLCTRDAVGVLHCVTGGTAPSGGAL